MRLIITRSIIAFLVTFISFSINGQETINARDFFIEAESFFLFEEYQDALPLYQRILREEPENYNVIYKIGICYLNDPYQKSRSIRFLLKASEHVTENYKENNYREKNAPLETFFYLAQAYRINKQLDEALNFYDRFKSILDPDIFDVNVVNEEIESCVRAKELMKAPVFMQTSSMGEMINSRFADIRPVISGDGKTILFTRQLQFYDGVFICRLNDDGSWTPPYNLTPEFALDGNSYSTGISYYGDEVYVYRSDEFDGNIYSSKYKDGRWQTLQKLNSNINTKFWESHASISPDGTTLYFTSNRKGGYGGLDIYKSVRTSGGAWGPAINLGPVVNSPFNEETPFISNDGKLFFSSLGHEPMGGYDIFVTELTGPGMWKMPQNMGYALNTTDDDLFFCPNPEGATGIMTRFIPDNSYGLYDIYSVKIYSDIFPRNFAVGGEVDLSDFEFTKGESVKISLIDNAKGKIISQVELDSSGKFNLQATQGSYQLLVDGKGVKPVSLPVELELNQDEAELNLATITPEQATAGEDLLLTTPSSKPKLELITSGVIVTDSSTVSIEINSEAGNNLTIEIFNNNELVKKEDYHLSKDKFTYLFNPQKGNNKLILTVTDSKGNKTVQEVNVYYNAPVIEEPVTEEPTKVSEPVAGTAQISLLADGDLKDYLQTLDSLNFDNLSALYELLLTNSEGNGFDKDDINELFSILLSQKLDIEFDDQLLNSSYLEELNAAEELSLIEIPLLWTKSARLKESVRENSFNEALADIISLNEDNLNSQYLLSLINDIDSNIIFNNTSEMLDWLSSEEEASDMLDLAATTQELDYFYQNLLISSDKDMKSYLTRLNLDSLHIFNAVTLIEHLFNLPDSVLSDNQILKNIENARSSQYRNIELFKESLGMVATGALKLAIHELDLSTAEDFEAIIDGLLLSGKTKSYNKQEVYALLLKMIGIDDVDEFLDEILKYTHDDLNLALAKLNIHTISSPLELIQYLISEAPYFDYSDSDINNLLLRMLMERGLQQDNMEPEKPRALSLFGKRRFVTTIILANVLLILIFIIIWQRRKKNS